MSNCGTAVIFIAVVLRKVMLSNYLYKMTYTHKSLASLDYKYKK